ncbi:MAG TPA: DUF2304 domain-containing protein [Candidatus Hodarchaeales archaeon]|nr:DUF2304 domain-containing protein [Candidatus Hodarchaeales archaeon]HLC85653.1 DUF2304 domain-containing protein [Candidatus Nanoarchaeia archaeon]
MVLGIQIMGVLFALVMLYITFLNLKRRQYEVKEFVIWLIVWLMFLLFTIVPQVLDSVTKPLSIVRRFDLLVVMGMMFVIGISYYNYSITRKNQRKLEQVVRTLALENPKKK